jgi:tetratricopeptide (TPR) repeat protein
MYSALESILPYFLKAAELDQLPDVKGKVKPKFLKDIKAIVRANRPFYINAGIYSYDKKNYKKAYESFKLYGDIPNLSIFEGEKWNIAKGDTTEMQIRFYAGLAASAIPDSKAAIAIYEEIKNTEYTPNLIYSENDIFQRLMWEYTQIEDTVALEKIVKEGFLKFPEDDVYVRTLINLSINSDKAAEAISYLDIAIAQYPGNAQFYDVLGQLYEADKKPDEAIKNMKKALEMEPENVEFLSHLGRVYFNLAVEKRGEADTISDSKKSDEIFKQSQNYFKEALPYFEKAFKLNPKDQGTIYALRSIYYSLTMNDEYTKMDTLFNSED